MQQGGSASFGPVFWGGGIGGRPRARLASGRFTGATSQQTRPRLIIKTKPRRYCYRCVGAARASTSCLHRPRPIRAHDVVARPWSRLSSRPPALPGTPLWLLKPRRQQHIQHVAEARSALTCGAAAMASRRGCAIEQAYARAAPPGRRCCATLFGMLVSLHTLADSARSH